MYTGEETPTQTAGPALLRSNIPIFNCGHRPAAGRWRSQCGLRSLPYILGVHLIDLHGRARSKCVPCRSSFAALTAHARLGLRLILLALQVRFWMMDTLPRSLNVSLLHLSIRPFVSISTCPIYLPVELYVCESPMLSISSLPILICFWTSLAFSVLRLGLLSDYNSFLASVLGSASEQGLYLKFPGWVAPHRSDSILPTVSTPCVPFFASSSTHELSTNSLNAARATLW